MAKLFNIIGLLSAETGSIFCCFRELTSPSVIGSGSLLKDVRPRGAGIPAAGSPILPTI